MVAGSDSQQTSFRLGTPADIAAIMAIEQIPEYREYIGSWTADEHQSAMDRDDTEYLVAEHASEVVGFAILQGLGLKDHAILLKRVAVRSPGQGIGRALVRFAMQRAFEVHRAHRFWLDVFVTNTRARHTYAELGFQQEGILRDAKFRDGAYHSQALMGLLEEEYFSRQQKAASMVTDSVRGRD